MRRSRATLHLALKVLAFLWLLSGALLPSAGAQEQEQESLKIGVITNTRDTDPLIAEYLSNYLTAYLEEIAKANHRSYNIVAVTDLQGKTMLSEGELDLLMPVLPSVLDRRRFSFVSGGMCQSMLYLYSRGADDRFNLLEPDTFSNKLVGIIADQSIKSTLEHFCKVQGLNITLCTYPAWQDLVQALHEGEISLIVDDGSHVASRPVNRIAPIGLISAQIMAGKNSHDLLENINFAAQEIRTTQPKFETALDEYFLNPAIAYAASFSARQLNFIDETPVLKVVFPFELDPLVKVDEDRHTISGLYPEILSRLSAVTGLLFDYQVASSPDRAMQELTSGRADIVLAALNHYSPDHSFFVSNPIYIEPQLAIGREDNHDHLAGIVRMLQLFPGSLDLVKQRHPSWSVESCSFTEDCVEMLKELHRNSLVLLPTAVVRRHNVLERNTDLHRVDHLNLDLPVNLLVRGEHARMIRDIINIGILKLNQRALEQRAEQLAQPESLDFLFSRYRYLIVLCVALFFVLSLFLTQSVERREAEKKQNVLLTAKNEELANALAANEAMKISRDRYRSASETDQLTGLLNKQAFEDYSRKALDKFRLIKDRGLLILLDSDHFKELNDTRGHQYGDEFIKGFAANLHRIFSSDCLLGRFGGDEFFILMNENLRRVKLPELFEFIRLASQKAVPGDFNEQSTVSMGVASVNASRSNYAELFKAADEALYAVKKDGRDGYCIAGGIPQHHREGVIATTELGQLSANQALS